MDRGGGQVKVSVWQNARRALDCIQMGSGVAVVGCSATMENGQVRLGIWPSAHVCADGAQAEGLRDLDASGVAAETLTAIFSPGLGLSEWVAGGALPTCAVALGEAVAKGAPIAFQINRCILEPPLEEDLIFS